MKALALILGASICLQGSLLSHASVELPEGIESVKAHISELVAAGKVPSMAVAVAYRGEIVWEQGFGLADIARKIPATPDTRYTLASVGKSITATAVFVLVRRGTIRLDDKIGAYLGPARLRSRELRDATIRQLLTMQAGVPHMWLHHWVGERETITRNNEIVARFADASLPPGSAYHYSNLSYGVLQEIVEVASHRKFADFVAAEVFKPLSMSGASLYPPAALGPNDARSYEVGSDGELDYLYSDPVAGAFYRASAHDLALFGMLHLKEPNRARPEGFTDALLDAMHATPASFPYACGWAAIDDECGVRTLISNGGIVGATSILKLVPSARLAVVCLTNTASGDRITDTIADEIISVVIPNYRRAMRIPAGVLPIPFKGDAEYAGTWQGSVRTPARETPFILTIDSDGRTLVSFDGKKAIPASDLNLEMGRMTFSSQMALPSSATFGEPSTSEVVLERVGDTMRGYVLAKSAGARPHFGLPFSFTLVRKAAVAPKSRLR